MDKTSRKQLAEIIATKMAKVPTKQLAKEIAGYLLAEKRSAELLPLMRDVMKVRAQEGTIEATVTSAHELASNVQAALMKLAAADQENYKQVILNRQQDSSTIAGVRLETPDIQLDLTIHNKLKALTQLQAERN